jgi:hypothetical protein
MAIQPARLCIISREPLLSAHFIAALQASLGPEDLLEIIIDRRHGGSSGKADLTEDRRRQHQVDRALEADGYAIVPASVDSTEVRTWRPRPSLLRPDLPPLERASPVLEMPLEMPATERRSPFERFSPVDDEEFSPADDEKEEFESIASFERRRPRTLIPALFGVLIGVTLIGLVLLLAGTLGGQSRLSHLFTDPLRSGPERSPGPPVVARPDTETPSAGGSASTSSVSPRDADRVTPRPGETNGSAEVTGTAPQEPSIPPKETSTPSHAASAPPKETGTPAQAGTGEGARAARPGLGATARPGPSAPSRPSQVAAVPPPGAETSKATSKQVVDAQRAELVGAPVSRGWGDSYAVRVLDSAGRPMVDASVLLVARMADGTVENVAMGALTEPGTYRGTVPTSRSTPVDLQVRVTRDGGSVEIPVKR